MTGTDSPTDPRLLAAVLRWWEEMGVDTLVEDAAEPWLGRAAVAEAPPPGAVQPPQDSPRAVASPPPPAPVAPPAPLPDTLEDFVAYLANDPMIPEAGPPAQRLSPFGTPGARIAIITDMPEAADVMAGTLFSGDVGRLFDAMLAAIGLDRASVYGFALSPGRPPTGKIADAALPRLGELAAHHAALAGAERVWCLGQATSRALLGADMTLALDKFDQNINHFRGKLPCIASLHPRLLLKAPQRKAAVWKDMQMLVRDLV